MLSLTEIVEYTLYREGQVLIPITAFKYDMQKLETLYYNVVRQAERYVPRQDELAVYIDRKGVYLPDVYQVKSLGYTGSHHRELIAPMIRPINSRYYDWDKSTHMLYTQMGAHYLVKTLSYYTWEKLHYLDELGMPLWGQEEFEGKLKAEPDITSLRVRCGNRVAIYERTETCANNSNIVFCSGDLGDAQYNTETRVLTVLINGPAEGPIVAEYLSKYKGFRELEIGTSQLINDWFAAELYAGLGSLHAVTQLEQSPIKWDAPNLIEYGRTLRQQVLERRSQENDFFAWLP